MKTAILSNVNLDMLNQMIGKDQELFPAEGYGQWISYALTKNECLKEFGPKIIFLILDGNALIESCTTIEDCKVEIEQSIQYVRKLIDNYPESIISVSTIDILPKRICAANENGKEISLEHLWEIGIREIEATNSQVRVFELKRIICDEGWSKFYSDKMWYLGSIPYSIKGFDAIRSNINDFILKLEQPRKKVFVLDLDNTLWGGVVGEDGPNGIILSESLIGASYRDAQKRIKEIAQTGILLAIVSKNNPEDVELVFSKNPHMILQKNDFVSIVCNWNQKYENIEAIAKTLNLGIDSFVFLDDNPIERESVKINLPDVKVPDFPADVSNLPKTITEIYKKYFFCWKETSEDKSKTEQYRQEALRHKDEKTASSIEDYLNSLQIHIELGNVKPEQKERCVQLLNKTNQFNTNTVRMDMQELEGYLSKEGNYVYVANVSDKYGDNGLVAELFIHTEDRVAVIDNFLMSCRVMGRQIEHAIISAVEKRLFDEGIILVKSSFVRTAKNKPVENLWTSLGFSIVTEDDNYKNYETVLPSNFRALLEVDWK